MAESGLEHTLTKGKVAGVPVWGAGVALAAIFIVVLYLRNRSKGASGPTGGAATFDPNAIDPSTGLPYGDQSGYGLPQGPIGDWLGNNPTSPSYPVGIPSHGLPSAITNLQWARLVADELLSKGSDPVLVPNALAKYLAGQTLNAQEQAVINLALRYFGQPPEGVLAPGTGTPAPPTGDNNGVPNKPIAITVFRTTSDMVILQWLPPVGGAPIGGYNVWMEQGPGAGQVLKTKNTNVVWQGLRPNTQYVFSVESFNSADTKASGRTSVSAKTSR
jgi:hypothetical protein